MQVDHLLNKEEGLSKLGQAMRCTHASEHGAWLRLQCLKMTPATGGVVAI